MTRAIGFTDIDEAHAAADRLAKEPEAGSSESRGSVAQLETTDRSVAQAPVEA
jgi:hypothetical protein